MRRELIEMMADGADLADPERALVALLAARGGVVETSGYVWSRAPGAKSAVRALYRAVKAQGLPPLDDDALGRAIDNAKAVMEQLPVAKVLHEEGLRARRRRKLGKAVAGGFDAANP